MSEEHRQLSVPSFTSDYKRWTALIPEHERYQYPPKLKQEIRLLHLEPAGTLAAPICASLKTCASVRTPDEDYKALSYTWGTTKDPEHLHLDGKILPIGENLAAALRRIRRRDVARVLWIDAVCIAQLDDEERTDQVAIMAVIFGLAKRVLAWVGEDTPDEGGKRALEYALARRQQYLDGAPPYLWKTDPETQSWLVDFYSRRYFSRRWIIQEIMAAKTVLLLCGGLSVKWSHFRQATTMQHLAPPLPPYARILCMQHQTRLHDHQWYRHPHVEEEDREVDFMDWAGFTDMLRMLNDFKGFGCGDDRDRIGALAALYRGSKDSFRISYLESVEQNYLRFATLVVNHGWAAQILQMACKHPSPATPGSLPSWVPDWRNTELGENWVVSFETETMFATVDEQHRLHMHGYIIPITAPSHNGPGWPTDNPEWKKLQYQPTPSGTGVNLTQEELGQPLVAAHFPSWPQGPMGREGLMELVMAVVGKGPETFRLLKCTVRPPETGKKRWWSPGRVYPLWLWILVVSTSAPESVTAISAVREAAVGTTMAEAQTGKISQLPDGLFTIVKASTTGLGPRLGRLALPGRTPSDTPHFLGNTSRGVVPHITQDNFSRHTSINGVYVGLEDFIERAPKQIPPLYKFCPPNNSYPLRAFIALPESPILVLGARRTPPVAAPAANPNTNETVSVCTAVGFRALQAGEYAEAAEELGADIAVALGDVPYGRALGSKRVEKATDRTIAWVSEHVQLRREREDARGGRLFAPLLPVSCANQQFYVDLLVVEEVVGEIEGLAVYDVQTLEDLPEKLQHLPRLGFTTPDTPHEVLRQIGLGVDVLTIPFINAATDAGIALDFTFPGAEQEANDQSNEPLPMGIDLWPDTHAVDLSPLMQGCQCYACTNHHRAYIQHLLSAKEMLAWVLLQIHNHHVMDLFLSAVRNSIGNGTFEERTRTFASVYESKMPEKTGQGPRVRGYQFKSEGPGEPKKNPSTFTVFSDGKEKLAESQPPTVVAGAKGLEEHGFAERQETASEH